MTDPQEFFNNENHLVSMNGYTFPYYQLPDLLQYPATAEVLVEFISWERSIGEEDELAVRYAIHHQEIRSSEDYEFIGRIGNLEGKEVFIIENFEEVPFEETAV